MSNQGISFQQVFFGARATQGISVAAELGIADALAGGAHDAAQLARKLRVNADALTG